MGIPDQSSATGGWPKRDNVHANYLQEVIDASKALVLAQKQQKEKDKRKQRDKYLSYTVSIGWRIFCNVARFMKLYFFFGAFYKFIELIIKIYVI